MIEVNAQNVGEIAAKLKAGEIPSPAKSLAEAVCRVMEQVSYVQKDKQMQGGGSYKYVSVEAVIDKLRPEMIRQQLVLLPAAVEPLTIESFEGKNGGRQNRTQVKYTFKLLHAPSGQWESVVVIGEAIDVGDKSSNKAMTAARKYALVMAFNIETGTDPDDTPSHTQERAAPVSAIRQQYEKLLRAVGARNELEQRWRAFDADVKAGNFGDADKAYIDGLFKELAKRFPKEPAKA